MAGKEYVLINAEARSELLRKEGLSDLDHSRVETTTLNYTPIDYLSTDDSKSSPVPYR